MTAAAPLVAVAHGSRDPAAAGTAAALAGQLRAQAPGLDVRIAFLDLAAPRVGDALAALAAEGHEQAVLVPLLLGRAYHARVDIPRLVAEANTGLRRLRVALAEVLGPDEQLETAAAARLAEAGVDTRDDSLGVLLASAGSSHEPANAAVRAVAERWAARSRWAGCRAAFAAAAEPDAASGIARLRARGARRIAVASWFLAPGLLPDRINRAALAADPAARLAAPLGPHPLVARVVLDRYREALRPAELRLAG